MGDAARGKTSFAKCIANKLAMSLQNNLIEPYYLLVGTVYSLREGQKDGLLQEHVPIVFDDPTPGHVILVNLSIHNKSWKLTFQ